MKKTWICGVTVITDTTSAVTQTSLMSYQMCLRQLPCYFSSVKNNENLSDISRHQECLRLLMLNQKHWDAVDMADMSYQWCLRHCWCCFSGVSDSPVQISHGLHWKQQQTFTHYIESVLSKTLLIHVLFWNFSTNSKPNIKIEYYWGGRLCLDSLKKHQRLMSHATDPW